MKLIALALFGLFGFFSGLDTLMISPTLSGILSTVGGLAIFGTAVVIDAKGIDL